MPSRTDATLPAAWWTLAFLWVAYLLNYVDRQVVFSIFPALRKDLQFSDAELGLIGTVFIWVYSLSMPVAGRIADLAPRGRVVIGSLALWSLATLGTALSGSVTAFLLWRAVMGITESLYVPAALGLLAALHPNRTRSKALAIHATAQLAGIAAGGWYGGWTADAIGWRPGFFALTAGGIAYAVVLAWAFRKLPELRVEEGCARAAPLDILRSRCYLALAAAFFAFCMMLWMLYAWLPSFIYERYGLSMTESGFTATFYLQASSALGVLAGGALGDRIVKRVRAGRFYVGGLGLLSCAPMAYLTLASGSLGLLKLASAGFGLLSGLMIANIFASAYDVISERNYGFGAGALNLAGGLAGGAGIFCAGLWKQSIGIRTLMGWAALAAAGAAVVMVVVVAARFQADRRRVGL